MRLTAHGQLITSSLEYDKALVNNPELRPYFRDGKRISQSDANLYNKAAAVADLLLDITDGNIEYTLTTSKPPDLSAWLATFVQSFKNSPILCDVYRAHKQDYSEQLKEIGDKACQGE